MNSVGDLPEADSQYFLERPAFRSKVFLGAAEGCPGPPAALREACAGRNSFRGYRLRFCLSSHRKSRISARHSKAGRTA
jgi:hypothetical protein